jgi:predicted regulator of Ras-like GTPase activity (Roadblock/LC7/MglB family)
MAEADPRAGNPETVPAQPAAGTDALRDILGDLNQISRDILMSMVISHDGLTMATVGHTEDADRAGAMCAALLSLCRSTSMDLQGSDVQQVLVNGNEGCMLLTAAGPQAILAVLAKPHANLGMLMVDARRAAEAITAAL